MHQDQPLNLSSLSRVSKPTCWIQRLALFVLAIMIWALIAFTAGSMVGMDMSICVRLLRVDAMFIAVILGDSLGSIAARPWLNALVTAKNLASICPMNVMASSQAALGNSPPVNSPGNKAKLWWQL